MPVTNSEILRKIWIEETPNSKKRRLVPLLSKALGITDQAVSLRLTGKIGTNDAEFLFMMAVIKRHGINTEMFESNLAQIRSQYGIFEEYELQ